MVHPYDPTLGEAEAGGLQMQAQMVSSTIYSQLSPLQPCGPLLILLVRLSLTISLKNTRSSLLCHRHISSFNFSPPNNLFFFLILFTDILPQQMPAPWAGSFLLGLCSSIFDTQIGDWHAGGTKYTATAGQNEQIHLHGQWPHHLQHLLWSLSSEFLHHFGIANWNASWNWFTWNWSMMTKFPLVYISFHCFFLK